MKKFTCKVIIILSLLSLAGTALGWHDVRRSIYPTRAQRFPLEGGAATLQEIMSSETV